MMKGFKQDKQLKKNEKRKHSYFELCVRKAIPYQESFHKSYLWAFANKVVMVRLPDQVGILGQLVVPGFYFADLGWVAM
jgi:hypothetical protein